jgi:hypothetical protein
MFRHIVLLTFTDEATDARLDDVVAALRGLPSAVPSIRSYQVGRDAGLADGNAGIGVVADFDDVDGYLLYRDHPAHVAVITELIRPVLAARSAIQHEL